MNTAKLYAVTQPVPGYEYHGEVVPEGLSPEAAIVWMARITSPKQRHEDAAGLLSFLVRESHWSPFDMVDLILDARTSRAIMAQVLRHWSARFQEFSQRYAQVQHGEKIDWSHLEVREAPASGSNRQGSAKFADPERQRLENARAQEACERAEAVYRQMIEDGVAPESARMVLPLATPTTFFMKGSVRTWMTYFWQRIDGHAQEEHRELARAMFVHFEAQFPIIAEMVKTHKPQVVRLFDKGSDNPSFLA